MVTEPLGGTCPSPPIRSLLNYDWGGAECEAFHFSPFHTAQGTPEAAMALKDHPGQKTSRDTRWQALILSCNISCQHLLIWSQAAKGCSSACKLLGTVPVVLQGKEQNNCQSSKKTGLCPGWEAHQDSLQHQAEVITNTINFLADLATKRKRLHVISSIHYYSAVEFTCSGSNTLCFASIWQPTM